MPFERSTISQTTFSRTTDSSAQVLGRAAYKSDARRSKISGMGSLCSITSTPKLAREHRYTPRLRFRPRSNSLRLFEPRPLSFSGASTLRTRFQERIVLVIRLGSRKRRLLREICLSLHRRIETSLCRELQQNSNSLKQSLVWKRLLSRKVKVSRHDGHWENERGIRENGFCDSIFQSAR